LNKIKRSEDLCDIKLFNHIAFVYIHVYIFVSLFQVPDVNYKRLPVKTNPVRTMQTVNQVVRTPTSVNVYLVTMATCVRVV